MKFKMKVIAVFLAGLFSVAFLACTQKTNETEKNETFEHEKISGQETAILTDAPNVPPPITRKHATKVIVNLEVKEVEAEIAEGVKYTFWTFGGKVPGKFIRIRVGDEVDFHLNNHPDSKMPHNIDLHAVTGPGGGGFSFHDRSRA